MRVQIRGEREKALDLRLPTGLLLNGVTARIAGAVLDRKLGTGLTGAQWAALAGAARRAKKLLDRRGEPLLEVRSEGEYVRIIL